MSDGSVRMSIPDFVNPNTIHLNEKLIIHLDDQAGMDQSVIEKIFSSANLHGRILIILHIFEIPASGNSGQTMPINALNYELQREQEYGNFEYFRDYLESDLSWDCSIQIANFFCANYNKYPAYFHYLLGHELGHAQICVDDADLHFFYCLIQKHFKCASGQCLENHEYPHEKLFDQYGLYIMEQSFSRNELLKQCSCLLNDNKAPNDYKLESRFNSLENLQTEKDLSGLRQEMVSFSRSFKDQLKDCWIESRKRPSTERDLVDNYFNDEKFEMQFNQSPLI